MAHDDLLVCRWNIVQELSLESMRSLRSRRIALISITSTMRIQPPGEIYTRCERLFEATDLFAADLFGLAPREARGVEQALDNGRQVPDRSAGSNADVFVGIANS